MKNNNGQFIFIELDDHWAGIYETAPGLHYLDCTDDASLKVQYLQQHFSTDDIAAWQDGVITDHV